MRQFGLLLLIGGVLGTAYFFMFFDTSVAVSAGEFSGRVNNIGLMSDRQNGLIASLVSATVGTLILVFAPTEDISSSAAGKKKCPFCAEMIQAEAILCRFCNREIDPSKVSVGASRQGLFKASALSTWNCACGKSNDEGISRCSCGRGKGGALIP